MEKKDAARTLYLEGFTQAEIANYLKVTENTISKWSRAEKWKDKRVSLDMLKDNSVQRILQMIDYQTKAIKRKMDKWLDEDQETTQLIERGDIDALQKLFTTIKKDSKKFTDYVSVISEFFEYLQHNDLEVAKSLTDMADRFLNEKRKLL